MTSPAYGVDWPDDDGGQVGEGKVLLRHRPDLLGGDRLDRGRPLEDAVGVPASHGLERVRAGRLRGAVERRLPASEHQRALCPVHLLTGIVSVRALQASGFFAAKL